MPSSALRESPDFVETLEICSKKEKRSKKEFRNGICPIEKGLVIDHIGKGAEPKQIWDQMWKLRLNLNLDMIGAQGVYYGSSGDQKTTKGLMSLPDFDNDKWERHNLKRLAALAPGTTVNVIQGGQVLEKYRLHVPPRIYNYPDIMCMNSACVSNPANGQREVVPYFFRKASGTDNKNCEFTCKYCEHLHSYDSIWTTGQVQSI